MTDKQPYIGGILRCDVCQHEGCYAAHKLGPMWLAKGMPCARCGLPQCVWDDVRHFATEDDAVAYASSLDVNEPEPPKAMHERHEADALALRSALARVVEVEALAHWAAKSHTEMAELAKRDLENMAKLRAENERLTAELATARGQS